MVCSLASKDVGINMRDDLALFLRFDGNLIFHQYFTGS